jgi:two-component system response regulator BaeR
MVAMDKDLLPQAMFVGESESERDVVSAELTAVEQRLLGTLASQPGRIFSRSELMGSLYRDHRVVSERTVDTHVKNLRRKLRALGVKWLVRSYYGKGYGLRSPG